MFESPAAGLVDIEKAVADPRVPETLVFKDMVSDSWIKAAESLNDR